MHLLLESRDPTEMAIDLRPTGQDFMYARLIAKAQDGLNVPLIECLDSCERSIP